MTRLLPTLVIFIAWMLPVHASTGADAHVLLPPTQGVFDYQLGGVSDTVATPQGELAIDVVVRDSTAAPLAGAYNICYVNGFQTQPGELDLWDPALLLHENGELVIDPAWPDEAVLDPSSPEQRTGILAMITPVIDRCADAGFQAIEIDNLDTYTRFPQIQEEGALKLARAYVQLAHDRGLAIGQKNAAEITDLAHTEIGFDFAITEECGAWNECGLYTDVYGDHVLQIEYPDSLSEAGITFADVCALPDRAPLTILRDRDLVPTGQDDHLWEACAPPAA